MTIYIDNDYKCYISNDGSMRAFEIPEFDDKCHTYIEGCRYIPRGESWIRSDGKVFKGEMLTVWRDSSLLKEFQTQYEESQKTINEYEAAFAEIETALGVTSE